MIETGNKATTWQTLKPLRSGSEASQRRLVRALRPPFTSSFRREVADRLGICLSALCILHCIFLPVAVVLLPTLGLIELHEPVHELLMIVLPLLAVAAFVPGYRRHRKASVFVWSVPGFLLLATSLLVFEHLSIGGAAVSVLGSVFLIRAHLLNRKLCACCETHPKGEAESTLRNGITQPTP